MNTQYSFLRSKTFWTIVVTFIITGTNGIEGLLPAGSVIYIQAVLSMLATYFHTSTAIAFGARN